MNPITIPNITIPVIGLPTIGIPSVGFPSASGGGLAWPKGLKESIKAIYDPASQGMTNYDVIEAYVEDFTTWNYLSSRGSATVTKNKIIITKSFSNTQNIIEDNKSPYDDIKIYVTGISEDNPLTINQYVDNKWVRLHTYTTDGIYIVKNRNLYVGFGTYITDDCNITITQLPTSILKDLSGNGNHAYLYGGKGKLNSGMGVYKVDYTTYNNSSNQNVTDIKPNSFVLLAGALSRLGLPYSSIIGEYIPSYAIRIQGISGGTITYYYRNENGKQLTYVIDADGDYILPPCYSEGAEGTAVNIVSNNNINNVTITQIPDYPNQLCYDGKMYAVCYGFPILTDYTVMAERTWFEIGDNSCFASKRIEANKGAFAIEYRKLYAENFGSYTAITFVANKKEIIVQSKEKYNDKDLIAGNEIDTNQLLIGGISLNNNRLNEPYIGCHGTIIVADRSFTEEEINWLKDNWKKI